MKPFWPGLPGCMNWRSTPLSRAHLNIAIEVYPVPLSQTMTSGLPCKSRSRVSSLATRRPLIEKSTVMAWHCLVKSSITVNSRIRRPLDSWTPVLTPDLCPAVANCDFSRRRFFRRRLRWRDVFYDGIRIPDGVILRLPGVHGRSGDPCCRPDWPASVWLLPF